MSLQGIREAIKDALETVDGLNSYDIAPERIEPPCAFPVPRSGTFNDTFGRSMTHKFEVLIFTSLAPGNQESQNKLDQYLDASTDNPYSVERALNAVSLGVHGDECLIEGYHDYGYIEYGGVVYIGVKIDCEIIV